MNIHIILYASPYTYQRKCCAFCAAHRICDNVSMIGFYRGWMLFSFIRVLRLFSQRHIYESSVHKKGFKLSVIHTQQPTILRCHSILCVCVLDSELIPFFLKRNSGQKKIQTMFLFINVFAFVSFFKENH